MESKGMSWGVMRPKMLEKQFEQATLEAQVALRAFWLVYDAFERTVSAKYLSRSQL